MIEAVPIVSGQAYKLFYLFDDYANSVFEKVSLCDNYVLKNIRYGFHKNIKVYGLIGPVRQIYHHLGQYYKEKHYNEQQKQKWKQKAVQIKLNCNLEEIASRNKAAVYLIKLQQKEKKDYDTVFLTLVSNNDLYYKKPIDQNSLVYLLLRFLGDLCDDIFLLYDDQIWNKFNQSDNPRSSFSNKETQYIIRKTSAPDIQTNEIACDSRSVNKQYLMSKIDFTNSLVISSQSYLQYFMKFDKNNTQLKRVQSIKDQQKLMWSKFLQSKDEKNYGFHLMEDNKNQQSFDKAIEKLKSINQKLQKLIQNLIAQLYKNIQKLLIKDIEKLTNEKILKQIINENFDSIYFYALSSPQIHPQIIQNQFKYQNSELSIELLTNKIKQNVIKYHNELTNESINLNNVRQQVDKIWQEYKQKIILIITPFLQISEQIISLNQNVFAKNENIEITRFQMAKTKKQNIVTKIQFKEETQINLSISQLRKAIKGITLNSITDIKIFKFKTKFSRNVKIVIITRKLEQSGNSEFIVLSIDKNQQRIIVKYEEKEIIFTLDEATRTIYLVRQSENILLSFVLDQIQIYKCKNEKRYNLPADIKDLKIMSYSFSRSTPQKFYYLDFYREVLHCFNITANKYVKLYNQSQTSSDVEKLNQKYDIVKAFSNNIFVALGNKQMIDIYKQQPNGQLKIVKSIKFIDKEIFYGFSTYADQRNQYLVIYEKAAFRVFCFQNMSSDNVIQQQMHQALQGNPIIDIFYDAKQRFGSYTTYTVCQNTPKQKQLNLYHILPSLQNKQKIDKYLSKYRLHHHKNQIYSKQQATKIYKQSKQGKIIDLLDFINQAEMRIPMQISTVESGNILPLRDGSIMDNFEGNRGTIQDRCKLLTFGVVERLLMEDPNKKTIVISIIGAQSTGKSYLLNMIFGTRFTVASCRTTIGIWMSIIKTQNMNFVALDCQGLNSVQRELIEECKLIKVLVSVSDYTILNQNKSMTNKSLTQLMSQTSRSIKRDQIKSKQLYNGQLLIVVRDVLPSEFQLIRKQLYQSFYSKKQIKEFLQTAFNSKKKNSKQIKFSLYPFPPFTQTQSFAHKANELRQRFIQNSSQRETRNSTTILKLLKVVLCQLSCDDSQLPEDVLNKINAERIQQNIRNAWKKGEQKNIFEGMVQNYKLSFEDTSIQIQQQSQSHTNENMLSSNNLCMKKLHDILKTQIKYINSVNFANVYKDFNKLLKQFFAQRYKYALNVYKKQVDLLQNKNERLLNYLQNRIKIIENQLKGEQQKFQLCLKKCSQNCCQQPCIKRINHNWGIEEKNKRLKQLKQENKKQIFKNKLSEEQNQLKQNGYEEKIQKSNSCILELKNYIKKFQQKNKLEKSILEINQEYQKKCNQVSKIKQKINKNIKYEKQFEKATELLFKTYELLQQLQFKQFIGEIKIHKQKLINILKQQIGNKKDLQQIKQMLLNLQISSILIKENIQKMFQQQKQLKLSLKNQQQKFEQIGNDHLNVKVKIQQKEEKIFKNQSLIKKRIQSKQENQKYIDTFKTNIKETNQKKQQIQKQQNILQQQQRKLQLQKLQLQKQIYILQQRAGNKIYEQDGINKQISSNVFNFLRQKQTQIIHLYQQYLLLSKQIDNLRIKLKVKQQNAQKLYQGIKLALKKSIIKAGKNVLQVSKLNRQLLKLQQIVQLKIKLNENIQKQKIAIKLYQNNFNNKQNYNQLISIMKFIGTIQMNEENNIKLEFQILKNLFAFNIYDEIQKNIKNIQWKKQFQQIYQSVQNFMQFIRQNLQQSQIQNKIESYLDKILEIDTKIQHSDDQLQNLAAQKQNLQKQKNKYEFLQKFIYECKINIIFKLQLCFQIYVQLSQQQETLKIAYEIFENLLQQLNKQNNDLKIVTEGQGVIKIIGISGEFSLKLQQLTKKLSKAYNQLQKKTNEQYQIQSLVSNEAQQINLILMDNQNESIQMYYGYILEIKQFIKDQTNIKMFKFNFFYNWLQMLKENQSKNQQMKIDNLMLFYDVVLRTTYQIQKTQQNLQKQKQYLKQQIQLKQQKLNDITVKIKKNVQQIVALADKKKVFIKQSQQNNQKLKNKQFQMVDFQYQINKLNQQIANLKVQVGNLRSEQSIKGKQAKQFEVKLNKIKNNYSQIKEKCTKFQKLVANLSQIGDCQKINMMIKNLYKEIDQNDKYKQQIQNYEQQKLKNKQEEQKFNDQISAVCEFIKDKNRQDIQNSIKTEQQNLRYFKRLTQKIENIQKCKRELQNIQILLQKHKNTTQNICSCLTNHKCDMKCQAVGCENTPCAKKSGHEDIHICALAKHRCGMKCQINEKCEKQCQKLLKHAQNIRHDCQTSHQCQQQCNYCNKKCQINKFQAHEIHLCETQKCTQPCILCKKPCSSPHHNHDDITETVTLLIKNNKQKRNQELKVKLHLCSQPHHCQSFCHHPGICRNAYENKKKIWRKDGVQRQYDYLQQIEQKKQCIKQIPAGQYKHQQNCQCDVSHTCNYRCPDCKSLCQYTYNHQNKKHAANHRNQQSLIYATTSEDGIIKLGKQDSQIVLNAGEISLFYKCTESCRMKGRAHYHLIQCPGGEACYQKVRQKAGEKGARHSNQIYKPNIQKRYDMLLCATYWEISGFQMPIDLPEFNKCNFKCNQQHKGRENQEIYCEMEAWHSLDRNRKMHTFSCDGLHQTFSSFQICFLIDVSGSMSDYIKQSKKVIQDVINTPSIRSQKVGVKFSVVGYRDHKMADSDLFKKLYKLCHQKKKAIQQQPPMNYHNSPITQNIFQQNLIKLQRKYNENKSTANLDKFTQIQKYILKYHYPFLLDVKSSRKLLDERRRPGHIHHELKKQHSGNENKPLKQILQSQLIYYINLIEEEQREEQLKINEEKLIQKQDFTTPQNCLTFLSKLKAVGGGDPPEAVFDGMDEVVNLKWSGGDNTLRYILHIFDAPPHGEKYDSNNQDYYPQGCPCKKDLKDIIAKLMKKKIKYIIYPLTQRVNRTMQIFKQLDLDFQSKEIQKQKQYAQKQFSKHATHLICEQMQQINVIRK